MGKQLFDKCGGYRRLHSFTYATMIHLETIDFCKRFIPWQDPIVVANAMLILIQRTMGMLKNQINKQGEAFLENDGFREKMYQTRSETREAQMPQAENAPTCPECSKPMRKRQSQRGEFWGCSTYPTCKGTRKT